MSRKSSKVRVYDDSKKKEKRSPSSVGKDSLLELRTNGIKGLLNMGLSKEAYDFVLSNVVNKPHDELERFRVHAQKLKENAENNKHTLTINATPYEIKMKMLLSELGIKYEFQKIYYVGHSFYVVDFYIPEYNVVIEIDGKQHHKWDSRVYDRLRTENLVYLHNVKKVVRFNNDELDIDTYIKEKLLKEFN